MIGQTVAHFEVLEKLGEGGMGVVWKARDLRLGRLVALKFLPADRLGDRERNERFIREAKAASSLNHPNIVTIYDIDTVDGATLLAMEYIAGQTLDRQIGRRGLPFKDVLKLGIQVASALATAHSAGIIHRDLKPANIIVTDAGLVKLLDFGAAKIVEPVSSNLHEPTQTIAASNEPLTAEGTILGTVAYMSPEQAEGKPVDARSDIFSFGTVLYEMLTGVRAFERDSKVATLGAILHEEPKPPSGIVHTLPAELERIVSRCLRKDVNRRFQHMDDVRVALEELQDESQSGKLAASIAPVRKTRIWLPAVGGVLALFLIAGVVWWIVHVRQASASPPRYKLTRLTRDQGVAMTPAISPDGKLIVYSSDRAGEDNQDLWLQQIAGGEPIRLTRDPGDDLGAVFSPDGSQIVFQSHREPGPGIYIMPALGGAQRLLAKDGAFPHFSPDGKWIAYSIGNTLRPCSMFILPATGGQPSAVKTNLAWTCSPQFTPDGNHLLFQGSAEASGDANAIDLWVVPVKGGTAVSLDARETLRRQGIRRSSQMGYAVGGWTPDGKYLLIRAAFGDATNIWRVPISTDPWRIAAPAQQLTTGSDESAPSTSTDGRMVFASLRRDQQIWAAPIQPNEGRVLGPASRVTLGNASEQFPTVAVDGRRLVFASDRAGNLDIWAKDPQTGAERALTATPIAEIRAAISPDGLRVAFARTIGNKTVIFLMPFEGGVEEQLCDDCGMLMNWTSDSKKIVYWSGQPIRYSTIDVETRQKKALLSHAKYDIHALKFSPDDKWIGFRLLTGPGKEPTYVAAVRDGHGAAESDWIQIAEFGGRVWWSPDGNLFYWVGAQDGSVCIWGRRLDPQSKRPIGEAFAVQHFHGRRRYVREIPFGYAMAPDRLYFPVQETSSDIWLAEPLN